MKSEQITLFYKQEKSDKVYKASLEEKGGIICSIYDFLKDAKQIQ